MASIRENIGRRILKSKKKGFQRQQQVYNFETAETAVLVFDTAVPNALQVIKSFRAFLSDNKIHNAAFGYVREKEVPEDMLFWKNFSFITRGDLNWYLRPQGEVAENFFGKNPDMLIDFTRNTPLELKFLVELSGARFKIGCFTEEENDYDLMINLDKGADLAFLAEQIKHYVSILQSKN
ncbi:MAG: hypothetical protein R2751_11990 [Bacteroidales bacterium]